MRRDDFFLKTGDTIGVAAPSARFDNQELKQGIKSLEKLGFKVKVPSDIYEQKRYLAGSDEKRANVIMSLFEDPEVKGIITARGGFGALRMLPLLDWNKIQRYPTQVIGFSDATALTAALVSKAGLPAVHGPNLVSLGRAGDKTLKGFRNAVTGDLEDLYIEQGPCLAAGKARGAMVGGNLATLAHLMGTQFQPDFSGGILFLEDVGEPAYKIDRMLSQMKMAGLFKGIQGVVTGSFENCPNEEYIPEIFSEIFEDYRCPVIMGLEAGHGEVNLAFPLGQRVVLDTSARVLTWGGD